KLNTIAVELNLMIATPEVYVIAIGLALHEIASAVVNLADAIGIIACKGMLCRQFWGLPITWEGLRTGNEELDFFPIGNSLQVLVSQKRAQARVELANGHNAVYALRGRVQAIPAINATGNGKLGWPIEIFQNRVWRRLLPDLRRAL